MTAVDNLLRIDLYEVTYFGIVFRQISVQSYKRMTPGL